MVQAHSFGISQFLPDLPVLSRLHNRRSSNLPLPVFPRTHSLNTILSVTSSPPSTKVNIDDEMLWNNNNDSTSTLDMERPGDRVGMAHFLKTTGPDDASKQVYSAAEDRAKRKKIGLPSLFRRKKDSLYEPEMEHVQQPRLVNIANAPNLIQRVSKDGAKYLQIVTSLGALDSAEDLNSRLFRQDSQRVSVSRATSNLQPLDTEDLQSMFDRFTVLTPKDNIETQSCSVLEAKAMSGSKSGQEYLSIKGPNVFASTSGRDSGFGLSLIGDLNGDTLIGNDLADLINQTAEITFAANGERKSDQPRKKLSKMASDETLTTVQSYKSGSKRPRSETEEHLVAMRLSRQSFKDTARPATRPTKHHHHRDLSVLDLDAEFGGNITRDEIECSASRATSRQRSAHLNRDRQHRPPPLMLPSSLPVGSSFDSQTPTIIPELERGLSSSESETFGTEPSTPTPSPKGRIPQHHRKSRSIPTPTRKSPNRFASRLGDPPNFLLQGSSPPVSSRAQLVRSGSLPSSLLLNTSFPAPSFPPPPPPTMVTPQYPTSIRSVPTSKRTSIASNATSHSARRAARLEARLESVEREKELLEAALKAVLLTGGKLNKCPCSLRQIHDGELTDTPSKCTELVPHRSSTIVEKRVQRSDSVESTISGCSTVSALEVFMATRLGNDNLRAQH